MEDRTVLETLRIFPKHAEQLQCWVNDIARGKELRILDFDTAEYLVKLAHIQGIEAHSKLEHYYWRLARKDKLNCRLVDFYSGKQDTIHRIYKIVGELVNLDKIEASFDAYLKTTAEPALHSFLYSIDKEFGYKSEIYGTYINDYSSEVDDHVDCEFYI
jgi:hypothetical protein